MACRCQALRIVAALGFLVCLVPSSAAAVDGTLTLEFSGTVIWVKGADDKGVARAWALLPKANNRTNLEFSKKTLDLPLHHAAIVVRLKNLSPTRVQVDAPVVLWLGAKNPLAPLPDASFKGWDVSFETQSGNPASVPLDAAVLDMTPNLSTLSENADGATKRKACDDCLTGSSDWVSGRLVLGGKLELYHRYTCKDGAPLEWTQHCVDKDGNEVTPMKLWEGPLYEGVRVAYTFSDPSVVLQLKSIALDADSKPLYTFSLPLYPDDDQEIFVRIVDAPTSDLMNLPPDHPIDPQGVADHLIVGHVVANNRAAGLYCYPIVKTACDLAGKPFCPGGTIPPP